MDVVGATGTSLAISDVQETNAGSYAVVVTNVVGSAIWDDLQTLDERNSVVRNLPRPDTGPVEVYSPFSANLVVRAGAMPQLITATRHVGKINQYHPRRTSNFNPQMDAWYRLGAAIIHPDKQTGP